MAKNYAFSYSRENRSTYPVSEDQSSISTQGFGSNLPNVTCWQPVFRLIYKGDNYAHLAPSMSSLECRNTFLEVVGRSEDGDSQKMRKRSEDGDSQKMRKSEEKMQVREKVGKSRNTVFFECFVAPEDRKVGSLKRRVRRHLGR
eukprot:s1737_g9.t1